MTSGRDLSAMTATMGPIAVRSGFRSLLCLQSRQQCDTTRVLAGIPALDPFKPLARVQLAHTPPKRPPSAMGRGSGFQAHAAHPEGRMDRWKSRSWIPLEPIEVSVAYAPGWPPEEGKER